MEPATFQFPATRYYAYQLQDICCGVRLLRWIVIDETSIYGDQHRFLPILVHRKGFRVAEIDIAQAISEAFVRVYRAGVCLSCLIDFMGVFVVACFTKKPLRFYGMFGSLMLGAGGLIPFVVALQQPMPSSLCIRVFMTMLIARSADDETPSPRRTRFR